LSSLPMFHVGGLNNQTLPALFAGATVSVLKRFDPGRWLAAVRDEEPTISLLVPAAMRLLGRWNWWSPAPLARWWERYGFREGESAAMPDGGPVRPDDRTLVPTP